MNVTIPPGAAEVDGSTTFAIDAIRFALGGINSYVTQFGGLPPSPDAAIAFLWNNSSTNTVDGPNGFIVENGLSGRVGVSTRGDRRFSNATVVTYFNQTTHVVGYFAQGSDAVVMLPDSALYLGGAFYEGWLRRRPPTPPLRSREGGLDTSGRIAVGMGVSLGAASLAGTAIALVMRLHRRRARQEVELAFAPVRGDGAFAPKDAERPYTIVFTDIQDAAALWAREPQRMGAAIDAHHAVVRRVLAAHEGYEVKTVGDSFMAAFLNSADAVEFALQLQSALVFDVDWDAVAGGGRAPPVIEPQSSPSARDAADAFQAVYDAKFAERVQMELSAAALHDCATAATKRKTTSRHHWRPGATTTVGQTAAPKEESQGGGRAGATMTPADTTALAMSASRATKMDGVRQKAAARRERTATDDRSLSPTPNAPLGSLASMPEGRRKRLIANQSNPMLWRGLRVQIGVHSGLGMIRRDPATGAYDYYGTVVNCAARVEAIGHGGQVLVTEDTLRLALRDAGVPYQGGPVPNDLHEHGRGPITLTASRDLAAAAVSRVESWLSDTTALSGVSDVPAAAASGDATSSPAHASSPGASVGLARTAPPLAAMSVSSPTQGPPGRSTPVPEFGWLNPNVAVGTAIDALSNRSVGSPMFPIVPIDPEAATGDGVTAVVGATARAAPPPAAADGGDVGGELSSVMARPPKTRAPPFAAARHSVGGSRRARRAADGLSWLQRLLVTLRLRAPPAPLPRWWRGGEDAGSQPSATYHHSTASTLSGQQRANSTPHADAYMFPYHAMGRSLGFAALRGMPTRVALVQLLPSHLARRRFPPLGRLYAGDSDSDNEYERISYPRDLQPAVAGRTVVESQVRDEPQRPPAPPMPRSPSAIIEVIAPSPVLPSPTGLVGGMSPSTATAARARGEAAKGTAGVVRVEALTQAADAKLAPQPPTSRGLPPLGPSSQPSRDEAEGDTSAWLAGQVPLAPQRRKPEVMGTATDRHPRALSRADGAVAEIVVDFVGDIIKILISPLSTARQLHDVRALCVAWRATPPPAATVSSDGQSGSIAHRKDESNSIAAVKDGDGGVAPRDAYIDALACRSAPVAAGTWSQEEAGVVLAAATTSVDHGNSP